MNIPEVKAMLHIGHRGLKDIGPENTLGTFARALADPRIHGIELDVHRVKDESGTPYIVCFHDLRVGRLTGAKNRKIHKLSFETLRTYRILGTDQKIPTLEEVLSLMQGSGMIINIELKGKHCEAEVARLIEHFVEHHGYSYYQFVVSSFFINRLVKFHKLCPEATIAPLRGQLRSPLKVGKLKKLWAFGKQQLVKHKLLRKISKEFELGNAKVFIHVHIETVNIDLVKEAEALQIKIIAWGVRSDRHYRIAREMDLHGVILDDPVHCPEQ